LKRGVGPTVTPMSDYETVHTMTDYYDGPLRGIADCDGTPHVYKADWRLDEGASGDTYRLSPVPARVFELALETWARGAAHSQR
jgi:hypothetical protein